MLAGSETLVVHLLSISKASSKLLLYCCSDHINASFVSPVKGTLQVHILVRVVEDDY